MSVVTYYYWHNNFSSSFYLCVNAHSPKWIKNILRTRKQTRNSQERRRCCGSSSDVGIWLWDSKIYVIFSKHIPTWFMCSLSLVSLLLFGLQFVLLFNIVYCIVLHIRLIYFHGPKLSANSKTAEQFRVQPSTTDSIWLYFASLLFNWHLMLTLLIGN